MEPASTKQILEAFGPIGVQALKNDLQKVSATGKTVDSVRYEVKTEGTVDSITYFAREFTSLLEKGIGPTTKGPSREMIESLTEYARARGMQDPEQAAWGLATVIQRDGDKAHRSGGRIVYSDTVDRLIKDIKKEVTLNFTTKFMKTVTGLFAILLILCSSCGSVQTINGMRVKSDQKKNNVKNYTMVCVSVFGLAAWGMYNVKAIE